MTEPSEAEYQAWAGHDYDCPCGPCERVRAFRLNDCLSRGHLLNLLSKDPETLALEDRFRRYAQLKIKTVHARMMARLGATE
jgi:hypothetical protein